MSVANKGTPEDLNVKPIAAMPVLLVILASCAVCQDAPWIIVPHKPDPAFALDADLSDWAGLPGEVLINTQEQLHVSRGPWPGPEDLSARVQLAWRSEGLYLAAEVRDDQLQQSQRGSLIYKGDHLEVFIDTTPDADTGRTSLGAGQFQFGLSPGNFRRTGDALVDVGAELFVFRPENTAAEGAGLASRRTDDGYVIEALLPFALMDIETPKPGMPLGLEVALSDCDSPEAAQEKYMTIGTAPWAISRKRLQPTLLGDSEGKATPPARKVVIRDEFSVPHKTTTEITFEAPPTPEGLEAYLRFLGRNDFTKPAGYAPVLHLWLNEQPITGDRLTNRPRVSTYRTGLTMTFMTGDGYIALPYSPDFDAVDKDPTYGLVDYPKACEFELRVTDLLREGANVLRMQTREDPKGKWVLVFGDVSVLFKAPPPPEAIRRPAPTGEIPVIQPNPPAGPCYQVSEQSSGRLVLTVGGETFAVESRFSTPDSGWAQGSNAFFEHTRRIEEGIDGVTVFDTFRNLTGENLPIMQRHTVPLGGRLAKVWLAGASPFGNNGSRGEKSNPTTYATTASAGIGLMPMNDEFQVHVVNYCLDGVPGMSDDDFVLRPGASYTAEWMIVPTAKPDFWDFVNAARRARDANFTLPYQFAFLSARPQHTDDFLKRFVEHKSPDLVCASINYPLYKGMYSHGTSFQQVDHSAYAKHNARLKELFPDLKTSIYFHCFLDVTEDAPERYADARTLRPDGTQANYGKDIYKLFFPTLDNSYGPAVAKNPEMIMGVCGADGVYWDELEYSAYQYHYGEPWDGCSGDIDPVTHELKGLKTSITLISQPWRVEQLKKILAQGPFIANGQPHTRTVASLKLQRFVETATISNCLRAILYSPIALGDHIAEKTEVDAYRWMLKALDYGCVYNWYSEGVSTGYKTLTEHMFPITPVELHEGYIIGQERIITNRSGLFGWGDDSGHEVHVYNDEGREVEDFSAPLVTIDGKTYTELRLAEDWSAAIIRKGRSHPG